MSYAEVAASGPSQTAEQARAPPVPEIAHSDDSVHSLIDVDSPHISSVPSDFESQSVKTDTQAERIEREEELKQAAAEAKAKAASAKEKAKGKGKKGAQYARDNADNPVFIGNAVLIGALGSVLGYQAYKKYTIGEFTWKVAGIGASIVGVFALGDYYVSKYFFQKYPPKK